MEKQLIESLKNAKSVTDIVFTKKIMRVIIVRLEIYN
jgi:hypothetical protein